MAIAYKSDVSQVQPEDFVVFSVNHRCIWDRYTDFQIPANMPECPNGKCTCAWFWQHREDAGGDEMYMNGFQCKITGATATTPIPQGQVPVKCADDSSKCVKGAKQPFYWDQAERNNNHDSIYDPPLYLASHGFADGAQNDIWDTVGGSTGAVEKSTSVSSSTAAATSTSAAATTAEAAATTTPTTPEADPATTPEADPAATPESDPTTTPEAAPTTTPAAQQGGSVQEADPTTPTTPATTASLTQGGQGHRTCRAKKTKRSLRRHVRHTRRSRAL